MLLRRLFPIHEKLHNGLSAICPSLSVAFVCVRAHSNAGLISVSSTREKKMYNLRDHTTAQPTITIADIIPLHHIRTVHLRYCNRCLVFCELLPNHRLLGLATMLLLSRCADIVSRCRCSCHRCRHRVAAAKLSIK